MYCLCDWTLYPGVNCEDTKHNVWSAISPILLPTLHKYIAIKLYPKLPIPIQNVVKIDSYYRIDVLTLLSVLPFLLQFTHGLLLH